MKNRLLQILLVLPLSIFAGLPATDNYPKNPNIDVLDYKFRIELSDTSDEIVCEETIEVRYLAAGVTDLRLDLIKASEKLNNKGMSVSEVTYEGEKLKFTHQNDALTITLPKPSTLMQKSSYLIKYNGVPASGLKIANNKYGDRTFFSDNWPNKGRNWLATVDHPYDKATCEFIVTAPSHYQVVSNGLIIEKTDMANGKRMTHWKQSVPIASWLYVLGVARFAVDHVDEFDGKSIESWVYYQDREAGFYDYAIPTKSALEFYSDRIGPFSYEKLANIQSNSVSGGMEAASAIFYGENSVVGDRNERWRNVIIHEIAHQWFGNSVTEYDWDDVWLSEGFATYFTLLFIEHQYGKDAFMKGLASSKKRVDDFDRKNPQYRIVHDNLTDMTKVTSTQTYQKGSWILHMLRGVVGTDIFWKGIRSYYKKFKDANATTGDFRREMEEASGMDLQDFFQQWLYKPGALKYKGFWEYDSTNEEVVIRIDQVQTDGSLFKMPLEVGIYASKDEKPVIKKVWLNEKTHEFVFSAAVEPQNIVLDPNFWVLMQADFKKN